MKFKVQAKSLVEAFKHASKGSEGKYDTEEVTMSLSDKVLKLTSVSPTTFFSIEVAIYGSDIMEEISYALNPLDVKKLAGVLPVDDTELSIKFNEKSNVFNLAYKQSSGEDQPEGVFKFNFAITGQSSSISPPKHKELGVVDANDFISVANTYVKISGNTKSDIGTYKTCIHLNFEKDSMKIYSCDGIVMSRSIIDFNAIAEEGGTILVKGGQISSLSKSFEQNETITLIETADKVGYIDNNGTISLVGKVAGVEPANMAILENVADSENSIIFDISNLQGNLSILSRMSIDEGVIFLEASPDKKQVKINDLLENRVPVPLTEAELEKTIHLRLSRSSLISVLSPIKTTKAIAYFVKKPNGEIAGIVAKPYENGEIKTDVKSLLPVKEVE